MVAMVASQAARIVGKEQIPPDMASGKPCRRSVASTTMPSVPSAPTYSRVRSYPALDLRARPPVLMIRPSGERAEAIEIDEPYPRGEEFRTSSRYNQHCVAVQRSLHGALDGQDIDH